jgi:hypothetical protein
MRRSKCAVVLVGCLAWLGAGCEEDSGGGGSGNVLADFNSGGDPTTLGGSLGVWNNGATAVAAYAGGAAQVSITGNTGSGPGGWSGAGLVVTLQGSTAPFDMSAYAFLEFDVRMEPGSQLGATKVKLEDAAGIQRPERSIAAYAGSVGTSWRHVRIPLTAFSVQQAGDPGWWSPVNLATVVRFVTVSVHDANTQNGDGVLQIDNLAVSN